MIEGASELHQEFFGAIEARDLETLNRLLQRHRGEIVAEFDSWRVVPDEIRGDQEAASRYVQSLVAIARVFEAVGEPRLMQRLVGPDESNPIVQWTRRLGHAQALSDAGEYDASNQQLDAVLKEMEGASGSAVVNLRPKIFGRLGFNALHQGDHAAALEYNVKAYDASRIAEDEEGCAAYYENIVSLRAIRALETEPERGRCLLSVRRLVGRAQDSADAGRYQASKQALVEALEVIRSLNDELFRVLLPKIHGLMGFNERKLGNATAAREHTVLALQESEALGDMEGVRIYTANLEALDTS